MLKLILIFLIFVPYCYTRFGKIRSKVVERTNGIPCEIAYIGRSGTIVGYWAYGSFDPHLPYQGWLE